MSRQIRILFVGLNYRYINPTMSLLPAALARGCRVDFYGPGYVSNSVLERGVAAYADQLGGVDLVVAVTDVVGDFDAARLARFLDRYTYAPTPVTVEQKTLDDIQAFLRANRERVILALQNTDVYSIPQATLDRFASVATYFIGWSNTGMDLSGRDGDIGLESFIQRKRQRGFEIGLYQKFIEERRDCLIEIGLFVGDADFAWGGISTRPVDVSVPGARYHRRERLLQRLKQDRRFVLGREHARLPFQIAERLGLRPWARAYGTPIYNLEFHRLLARSKAGVTDGGLINLTIRKFFEIPAAGAVLVCWPTAEFPVLGFEDRVNCICVREEADVVKALEGIAREPEAYQHIATAGRELMLRRHSAAARGDQMRSAFEAILAGRAPGSAR